jgi:MYXO-CTERM domain-containing protein
MLLHNLYAIATPGTWNGSPDADPCAPVMGDSSSTAGADAGTQPGDDAGTTTMDPPAGCGCRSTDGAPAWPMFALLGAWLVRRRR